MTELFLWAFGRKPTAEDMQVALAHIAKHEKTKKVALLSAMNVIESRNEPRKGKPHL